MSKPLVIFGSAEIASLARYYFENDSPRDVVGFTVDDEYLDGEEKDGLPLVGFSEVLDRFPPDEFDMHVALSYQRLNQLRAEKYSVARAAGYQLASFIASTAVTWPDLRHGDNCFILENQTIQPTVTIGSNVMIWSGNHIGHGTTIDDHAYIASHVCISGHCRIGSRAFVGVNATLKDFTTVGADAFVAMDASVTKDVPDWGVVLGSRSSFLAASHDLAIRARSSYFGLA